MSDVVTRFAPSPTGRLTVGSARTALFNYVFTKQYNGKYILRIEDTDKERSSAEFEKDIVDNLLWLGMEHDAFYRQSDAENLVKHTEALKQLINSGVAYISKEKPTKEGEKDEVIRFKNKGGEVTFTDSIRGEITTPTDDLGDFVIAKDLTTPLYHIAVVVDDNNAGVTHVVRGEDGLANTPRQILLQQALGYKTPTYTHIPFILAEDRSKLSKRHGAQSIQDLRNEGYLKEAIINYLILLGWHPKNEKELFSFPEILSTFDISRAQKGGAVHDIKKLRWINKQYMDTLSDDVFLEGITSFASEQMKDGDLPVKLLPLLREKVEVFSDVKTLDEEGEFDYFVELPSYETPLLQNKKSDTPFSVIKEHLAFIFETLTTLSDFSTVSIKNSVWEYATEKGRGDVLWPMRVALTGREKSADPFTVAAVIGKEETLKRITTAITKMNSL